MLSTLRDKKTMHVVLWGLVVAFVATIFIAWGAGSTLQKNMVDPNVVAKVGDQKITYDDFNKVYQPQLDRLYNMVGETPSADQLANLRKHILDSLIDNAILEQTASKLGISVSDEELAAALQHEPYFADENGKFSKEKYIRVLEANKITPAEFESHERAQMLLDKTHSILSDSILYTPDELGDYKSFLDRELKADYVYMSPADYEKSVTYTESDLKDFYEEHKAQFDRPERRKVRHILLQAQGSTNPLAGDPSEKALADYREQVLSGKATFASLAEKYSQDPGSKKKGGDLGWVTKGQMVKEFEDAVFDAKKGEVTKPFKTQYGYHIAQIVDIEPEYKSTFAQVRTKVLDQYKKTKANQKLLTTASELGDKVKNKVPLPKAAEELGLKASQTAWFSKDKDIAGIKGSKPLVQELLNLYPGEWAGPFPLNNKEYFFQITEAKEGKPADKIDQSDSIAQRFMANKADAWFKDFLNQQRKNITIKTYLNS